MRSTNRPLPLGLSMLWESTEPEAALRERFGFADLSTAADWVTAALDERWRITVTECSRLVISDRNAIVWVDTDRGRAVVKWSRDRGSFGRLAASTDLLSALAERGIPVAAPRRTTDGLVRVVLDGPSTALSVAVQPVIEGDWLDVTDPVAVASAGASLAELHLALGDTPVPAAPALLRLAPMRDRIEGWLADGDRGYAPDASRRLRAMLAHAPALDDEPQLVHRDFRAANILTQNSAIVAVLDFDEAGVDHRVNDLAQASVYLATLFTEWAPTPPAVQDTFRAGYESVRPLTATEAGWYDILQLWQALVAIPGEHDPAGWRSAV